MHIINIKQIQYSSIALWGTILISDFCCANEFDGFQACKNQRAISIAQFQLLLSSYFGYQIILCAKADFLAIDNNKNRNTDSTASKTGNALHFTTNGESRQNFKEPLLQKVSGTYRQNRKIKFWSCRLESCE